MDSPKRVSISLLFVHRRFGFLLHLCFELSLFFLGFPHRQKFHVDRSENKCLNKVQSIGIQPVSHNFPAVTLAEFAKVFRVNDLSLNSTCPSAPAFQQPPTNPLLHFFCANVQCFGQTMLRKALTIPLSPRGRSCTPGGLPAGTSP